MNKINRPYTTLFIFLAFPVLVSCMNKRIESMKSVTGLDPDQPMSKTTMTVQKIETEFYDYPHGGRRDPFLPLIGAIRPAVASNFDNPNQGLSKGDISNLILRGIMRDKKGKIALISSSNGEPYTLRSGRIFDKKNRKVKGMAGIIKEKSVVLISQDRLIKELTIRENE